MVEFPFRLAGSLLKKKLPEFSARLFKEVKLLSQFLEGVFVDRCLEIGCGYGRLTPWISTYCQELYAIEPEQPLLNYAKKLYPHVKFYNAKVQNLPFPNDYFNLIVSWNVLQHIPPKYFNKAIEEIKRVASQEAIMLLSEAIEGMGTELVYLWPRPISEWKKALEPWKLIRQEKYEKMGVLKFKNRR